jgi:hypothetical protein
MENVVLAVTTHGAFLTKKNKTTGLDEQHVFTVPTGMTLTILSVGVPGVCNIITDDELTLAIKHLIDVHCKPDATTKCTTNVTTIPPETIQYLKDVYTRTVKSIEDLKNKDDDELKFLRRSDLANKVKTYTSGQPVPDKVFSRDLTKEERGSEYDLKITLLNKFGGTVDFFGESATDKTYLSGMVNMFHESGVRNVILYDFSCGSMPSVKSSRTERSLRRDILKGTGRKRRQSKKTKTRRAKKGIVQWRH